MLKLLQHLLPNGLAFRTTADKFLRRLIAGLAAALQAVRDYTDRVFLDVLPEFTRRLERWEDEFGLRPYTLTMDQRRTRLAAQWRETGGQSPGYIQDILQANGFDVYVHEWWVPGTEPRPGQTGAATARDPRDYLTGTLRRQMNAGEALAQAGEAAAIAGEDASGTGAQAIGYPLVNIIVTDTGRVRYTVPSDPNTWPYFMYIGGQEFGQFANVPPARRDEFEALCLKLRPAHLWIGVLVNFT